MEIASGTVPARRPLGRGPNHLTSDEQIHRTLPVDASARFGVLPREILSKLPDADSPMFEPQNLSIANSRRHDTLSRRRPLNSAGKRVILLDDECISRRGWTAGAASSRSMRSADSGAAEVEPGSEPLEPSSRSMRDLANAE